MEQNLTECGSDICTSGGFSNYGSMSVHLQLIKPTLGDFINKHPPGLVLFGFKAVFLKLWLRD